MSLDRYTGGTVIAFWLNYWWMDKGLFGDAGEHLVKTVFGKNRDGAGWS
jgi:hypothetical protein